MDPIKQKITELIPGILELKFGCQVKIDLPGNLGQTSRSLVTIVDSWIEPGEEWWYRIRGSETNYERDDFVEILGRPITLADVLRAIEMSTKGDGSYFVRDDGTFFKWEKFTEGGSGHHGIKSCYVTYKFALDYDSQTTETKEFIGKLIGV